MSRTGRTQKPGKSVQDEPPKVGAKEAARGALLRSARIRAGHTNATEFADLVKVSPNTVYRHESGRMAPSVTVLVAWARACGVPLESLAVAVERKGAA